MGEYQLNLKRRKKEKALEILGGKCQICGYDKCMGALEFHHVEGTKEFNIGSAIPSIKWERIEKELKKCIILCSNCHHEHHYKKVENHDLKNLLRQWVKVECEFCKKKFDTTKTDQQFCSNVCRGLACRKVERPSKDDLKNLLDKNISWTRLGQMFGVSDNGVRKWAKQYELI